jgi:hypothetical protein
MKVLTIHNLSIPAHKIDGVQLLPDIMVIKIFVGTIYHQVYFDEEIEAMEVFETILCLMEGL